MMDPDTALETIRALVKGYQDEEGITGRDVTTLVETVAGLDEWLTKGGFLPKDWK